MAKTIRFVKTKGPGDTFTAKEVCRILGISKSTLVRLEKEGRIPKASSRKGRMRARAYSWDDLEALAEALKANIPEAIEI